MIVSLLLVRAAHASGDSFPTQESAPWCLVAFVIVGAIFMRLSQRRPKNRR